MLNALRGLLSAHAPRSPATDDIHHGIVLASAVSVVLPSEGITHGQGNL